jgi:hypothetical protein
MGLCLAAALQARSPCIIAACNCCCCVLVPAAASAAAAAAATTCLLALPPCCGALPVTCGDARPPTSPQQRCTQQPRECEKEPDCACVVCGASMQVRINMHNEVHARVCWCTRCMFLVSTPACGCQQNCYLLEWGSGCQQNAQTSSGASALLYMQRGLHHPCKHQHPMPGNMQMKRDFVPWCACRVGCIFLVNISMLLQANRAAQLTSLCAAAPAGWAASAL